ncbi:hypothetical protein GH741_21220 [Aquibacillus halophilus]|uniref:Uncharacterized protein n=1 Tax=Aquibacillus halophilus TaxID=930132 RepID=A0A6A8DMW1_9BACI|nr:hypothetical protein [Aquibacillus halophilus]MRH45151.1 hypothetical protein [Aquibacillus halophilus]
MQCCRSLPCPAGKATAENPGGSGFLPRKLKRCPRKATARSANQHISYVGVYSFCVNNNLLENSLNFNFL